MVHAVRQGRKGSEGRAAAEERAATMAEEGQEEVESRRQEFTARAHPAPSPLEYGHIDAACARVDTAEIA